MCGARCWRGGWREASSSQCATTVRIVSVASRAKSTHPMIPPECAGETEHDEALVVIGLVVGCLICPLLDGTEYPVPQRSNGGDVHIGPGRKERR